MTTRRFTRKIRATLHVRGPGSLAGTLQVRWATSIADASQPATVVGTLNGDAVSIQLPAPWVPQS